MIVRDVRFYMRYVWQARASAIACDECGKIGMHRERNCIVYVCV